ncbi:SDR family NAD(P)-dependent oxidoreductase [Collimonas silvisoli]|uniref:SDR family NAD(P)-dependent oxidoreductase n=1 Tax=Collimonas silvisoli TaxID=2825884 RepID=UPI001B8D2589|nr:SDR family oxidoreductase [Collimonas silvisoli]
MSKLNAYFPLKNKVAVITGAARGMALHIAGALSAADARLAILDARVQEGRAVARMLGGAQDRARFWQLDVSDNNAVQRTMAAVEAHFGRIDILINSAGIDVDHPSAPELPIRQWERAAQLNLNGGIVCTKHVLAAMVRVGGGSIVNVLSLYNLAEGRQDRTDEASTEALHLAGLNAQRYASCNIRINSIQPGFLRPPKLAEAMREAGELTQMLTDRAERQMLRGSGSATDVAAAILYLVSDASRFVSGSELVIDAGYGGR